MKQSSVVWGTLYIVMGCLFTVAAISAVDETVWNFTTILFVVVAVFDFRTAFRYLFRRK